MKTNSLKWKMSANNTKKQAFLPCHPNLSLFYLNRIVVSEMLFKTKLPFGLLEESLGMAWAWFVDKKDTGAVTFA